MAEPGSRGEVVIVGGGVAALETPMALHDLAPAAVRVRLVAAEPDFVYRPMSVAEPLGGFVDLEVPLDAAQAALVER
jgi:NADH dehydrogenase FAD-containing subunit